MSKYLKLFNEDAEYQQFKETDEYILPNVSYVKADNVVYYNPFETVKSGVIMARYNATEDNMLALADTSNVKSLKVNGENVFEPFQITNKSIEIVGKNVVVNEDGTGEYPDEYMHFFSEGTPIKWIIKLKDDSLNITDFNCFSVLRKYDGEDVKWCDIFFIENAINDGLLSFDETNNALIVSPQFDGCTALGFVLGNVDVEQEMWVPVFVDTVNEMEIKTGGMPDMYYFNEVGEYDVEIELIDNTLINGATMDYYGNPQSNSIFFDRETQRGSCLTSIVIPDSVTEIGNAAFAVCLNLADIYIGSGVTEIGGFVFINCQSLTSIVIPDSVTSIGEMTFNGCSGLTSVHIGSGVTEIGRQAFDGCSGLKSVHIGSGVISIEDRVFSNCSSLSVITCNAITAPTISNDTFYGVTYDGVLKVPEGSDYNSWMSTDNYYLGYYNWNMECIIQIPDDFEDSVIMTSESNPRVMEICYNQGWAASPNEMLASEAYKVTNIGTAFAASAEGSGEVEIPEMLEITSFDEFQYFVNVKEIESIAFTSCKNLASIIIPDSVTTIKWQAFAYCEGLTNIHIGSGVTEIGDYAFDACYSLTSINIPDSVTSIGYSVFTQCSGLTSVHIGSGVTEIGQLAFNGCNGLTSIVVSEGNTKYDSRENCNCIIETATNILIKGCKNSFIPDSVTSIGYQAFQYCSGLTSIHIGSGVTEIGDYAFFECSGLTSIVIPDSVTTIGDDAFEYCLSLNEITCNAITAPTISSDTFYRIKEGGILKVPVGSDYSTWMSKKYGYLGYYNWTVEYV